MKPSCSLLTFFHWAQQDHGHVSHVMALVWLKPLAMPRFKEKKKTQSQLRWCSAAASKLKALPNFLPTHCIIMVGMDMKLCCFEYDVVLEGNPSCMPTLSSVDDGVQKTSNGKGGNYSHRGLEQGKCREHICVAPLLPLGISLHLQQHQEPPKESMETTRHRVNSWCQHTILLFMDIYKIHL